MRRNDPSRKPRTQTWRIRAVMLALVGTGLMTAIASAAIGSKTGGSVDGAMAKAITHQRIAEGQLPLPTTPQKGEALSREQILAAVTTYESEMNQSLTRAEAMKTEAYRAKDIIRLNFVSEKLEQIKQVIAIAQPAIDAIRVPGQDMFVMLTKLSTIRQGAERVKQAIAEAEASLGDSADTVGTVSTANATDNLPGSGDTDPTAPASPTTDSPERPVAASPYR
jgi:hypothetical protein